MQWYEREGFYKKRFLREISFIDSYNRGKRIEDKISYDIEKESKALCAGYRYMYLGKPYYILCIYPPLYPKVRIMVKVFNGDFVPFEEGYHNTEGLLCLFNHYPNEWNEDYGIEYILGRVNEWFESGRFDSTNILPPNYNVNNEFFIFIDPLTNIKEVGWGVFEYAYFNKKACVVTKVRIFGREIEPGYIPKSFKVSNGKTGRGLIIFTNKPVPKDIGVDTFNKIKTYMNQFKQGKRGIMKFAQKNSLDLPVPLVVFDKQNNSGYCFLIGEREVNVGRFGRLRVYEDIFKRIPERDDLERLKEKKVALLGLGALGSTIAAELARSGIKKILLVDYDKLSIENIGRHDLTLRDIDHYKVDAVKKKILDINPIAECLPVPLNVLDDLSITLQLIPKCDIVVSTMDDQEAKMALDSIVVPKGKKVIYAGVFYNAVAGFVLVSEKKLGCFRCLSNHMDFMSEKKEIPDFAALVPEDVEYNCGLPTFPGGSINTHTVALLAARVTVDTLLQKRELNPNGYPYNFYLLGNEVFKLNGKNFFNGYMDLKKYVLPGIEGCNICDEPVLLSGEEEELYNSIMGKLIK
ncbi:MAG: ThiF family adenylyltransferase [Peptococcaceae bacterium]|nr:ThiF family adenylyltransferase [Peptococcaceae bacterium]